jgi:hypothetical protein
MSTTGEILSPQVLPSTFLAFLWVSVSVRALPGLFLAYFELWTEIQFCLRFDLPAFCL